MAIISTKDKFQVNYKNPQAILSPIGAADGQVVNGRGDPSGRPYIYAIREEQFTYEWFLREAGSWTLVSKSFAYRPERAPTMKLIWMNWAPLGIEVEMANYWDENLCRLYVNYWWKASLGEINWAVEIQTLSIKLFLSPIVGGWYAGDIIQTLIDMNTLLNIQQEVKDVYIFKWTPGEGDNTLTTIPSLERILQEEQASKNII